MNTAKAIVLGAETISAAIASKYVETNCLNRRNVNIKIFAKNYNSVKMNLFVSQHIQAIYENGILRPLQPLDLPENSGVEIDVRDVSENVEKESVNKFKIEVFEEWMASLDPNTPNLTDEQISRESIYEEQIKRQL